MVERSAKSSASTNVIESEIKHPNGAATVEAPLQRGVWVPPYAPQPKRKSSRVGFLVGIGVVALIILLALVFLLPNLLSNHTNNQSQSQATTQSPTISVPTPTPTSTRVANACSDQRQMTINDTANVLDSTQVCNAISACYRCTTLDDMQNLFAKGCGTALAVGASA